MLFQSVPQRAQGLCRRTTESAGKYSEIIADNLKKAGWSLGYVSAVDSNGRTIWIADAHRNDGQRVVVQADEKLRAFIELESAIRRRNSNRCTSQEAAGP